MPTPLARLLRALGGDRYRRRMLKRIPNSLVPCTDPKGPDCDSSLRHILGDLSPEERARFESHLRECQFCRDLHEQATAEDHSELLQLLKDLGYDVSPDSTDT